ncbi:hypothetical protein [Pelobacter seleniigenes]|uniref:hypothetical protein n=1 Tax=Pelobacter seleniigenes TaxID=407188 RepID=UPI001B8063E5|nr:hypothetical protein [Pelobacter seleniigenes]
MERENHYAPATQRPSTSREMHRVISLVEKLEAPTGITSESMPARTKIRKPFSNTVGMKKRTRGHASEMDPPPGFRI